MADVRKKRFIAGARCPECGLEDTTYMLWTSEGESRHCARCGFEDRRETVSQDPPGEWTPVKIWDKQPQ